MRTLGNSLAWLFVVVCALIFFNQIATQLRIHFFPPNDAYFESFLNRKFFGYRKAAGRTLKCRTHEKTYQGYFVDCQYYRDGKGEDHTYQWFDLDGSYISSLDGG